MVEELQGEDPLFFSLGLSVDDDENNETAEKEAVGAILVMLWGVNAMSRASPLYTWPIQRWRLGSTTVAEAVGRNCKEELLHCPLGCSYSSDDKNY